MLILKSHWAPVQEKYNIYTHSKACYHNTIKQINHHCVSRFISDHMHFFCRICCITNYLVVIAIFSIPFPTYLSLPFPSPICIALFPTHNFAPLFLFFPHHFRHSSCFTSCSTNHFPFLPHFHFVTPSVHFHPIPNSMLFPLFSNHHFSPFVPPFLQPSLFTFRSPFFPNHHFSPLSSNYFSRPPLINLISSISSLLSPSLLLPFLSFQILLLYFTQIFILLYSPNPPS